MSMYALGQAMHEVKRVIEHGDNKHGVDQWVYSGTPIDGKIYDHLCGVGRHMERRMGNGYTAPAEIDSDSGIRAMAHVAARALIALQLEINRANGHA